MAVKDGEEDMLTEFQKKIIDWSTEGNVERVKDCIANGESTETKDENVSSSCQEWDQLH